jgi:hypothetical protein
MLADKKIYCFWFGDPMSDNRKRCFESIVKNSGVEVVLITESNLKDYIHKEYPLHPGFSYLSATHKSDYLRSYVMHIYGGGYSDIKHCNFDWNFYIDELNESHKLFSGAMEKHACAISYLPAAHLYNKLVSTCQFIFKPQTKFTKLWYDNTQRRMDVIYPKLIQHPGHYHPRAVFGGAHQADGFKDSRYPLKWSELLGRIFLQLQYQNIETFLSTMPYPDTEKYR